MPIYAYKCESCGHAKDVLQKMSDAPLSDCPACGAPAFRKQLTAAGFQLKGSGWYATDFRNGSAKPPATGEAASQGGESKSGEGKVAEGTSSGSQPADAKAVESKPAESKPSEGKTAAKGSAAPSGGSGGAQ